MNLSDFYPLPKKLIANEVNTVKFLSENAFIKEHLEFYNAAAQSYAQYRYGLRTFSFGSYLDVHHSEMVKNRNLGTFRPKPAANLRLMLSGLVELKADKSYGNISYALVVANLQAASINVLRKFHFDVTTGAIRRQPHPRCHLQYCGGLIPVMQQLGYKKTQLEHLHMRLSEPRVFFWPMSLALLIDMALREFPDEKFAKFVRSPEWQNVIRENEDLLLGPFHEKCVEVISNNERRRKTLAEAFYVK